MTQDLKKTTDKSVDHEPGIELVELTPEEIAYISGGYGGGGGSKSA
ncbi:hypothetical protein [Pseudomonas syringae]|nr:hypothetical protein [Pseudomonas syringae]